MTDQKDITDSSDMCPSVTKFYEGRSLFLTGGTGFIGKVFLEKILRCTDVKTVYLLIRPKKGVPAQERLVELLKGKVFERVCKDNPNCAERVVAIAGDIAEPELGISEESLQMLKDNCSVVFHSAATIRFEEPLKVAMNMNVLAVRKVVQLCRKLPLLESFVHVSTAYSNCDRSQIDEHVYPTTIDPQKLIDMLEWMDDDMVQKITPMLIEKKPNTYTYTKHLAEVLLMNEANDLPLAIIRPSIVGAALREPFPGWIDNTNGPGGFYIAYAKGILRTCSVDLENICDVIPVDIPCNMMIAVGCYTATMKPKDILIYHCNSGGVNPYSWDDMRLVAIDYFKRTPLDAPFRRPHIRIFSRDYRFIHEYWNIISHLLPAYIADFAYRMIGKKPRMVRIYQKLAIHMDTLKFFMNTSWDWSHRNMDMIMTKMSAEDKQLFYIDPRQIHWPSYIENYCLGTKIYVMNESIDGIPAAKAHMKKLRNIRYCFNTLLGLVMWRVLIARSEFARNIWSFAMGLLYRFLRFFKVTSSIL